MLNNLMTHCLVKLFYITYIIVEIKLGLLFQYEPDNLEVLLCKYSISLTAQILEYVIVF